MWRSPPGAGPAISPRKRKERGLRLQISKWARPAPNTAPTASKAAGLYMICTLSKHAAEQAGFEDALMLDYRGLIAEATGANMFLVMNGELHTPTPDCFLKRHHAPDRHRSGQGTRASKWSSAISSPKSWRTRRKCSSPARAAEVTPIGSIEDYNSPWVRHQAADGRLQRAGA